MQINNKTRRQLSLEQSSMATVQDPRHHVETLQLPKEQNQRQRRRQQRRRRQWSADDAASLEVYTNFSKLEKPKVRMAWADSDNNESIEHVEIIARQIPTARKSRISNTRPAGGGSVSGSKTDFGLSRSIENGKKKLNSTSSLEKAAILCSRQELAERLRLAWKHRQETRTNINIFLARHTSEEYSNSELSVTRTTATTTPLSFIASTNDDHPTKSFAAESTCLVDSVNRCANLDSSAVEMTIDDTCEDKEDVICASECRKGQLNEDLRSYDKISNYSNEEYKGEFKEDEFGGENSKEVENLGNVRFKVNEEASIVIETEIQDETRTVVIKSRDTAKEKRASFRSCANKAFLVPMVDLTKPTETDEKSKRTKSAPPGERAGDGAAAIRQINGRAICNQMDKVTDKVDDRNNGKFENTSSANVNREQRSVRSAPTKRRSKSKRRTSQACREEENDENRKKGENRSVARRGKDCRLTDVVTMVSLVSSADSDSEEENSPSDDKLINELRKKLPTTPIIKTASPSTYRTIRKPLKTVSFQNDSIDDSTKEMQTVTNKEYKMLDSAKCNNNNNNAMCITLVASSNESYRKTEVGASAMCISNKKLSAGIVESVDLANHSQVMDGSWYKERENEKEVGREKEEANEKEKGVIREKVNNGGQNVDILQAILTDREKRCLAVPIGDLHDKKRKLLRTRSMCRSSENFYGEHIENTESKIFIETKETTDTGIPPLQFDCQTTKEKECWHLYRRMCDKGVYISFDTVLRGMLTPTEYRLRQKQLSQEF